MGVVAFLNFCQYAAQGVPIFFVLLLFAVFFRHLWYAQGIVDVGFGGSPQNVMVGLIKRNDDLMGYRTRVKSALAPTGGLKTPYSAPRN